MEQPRPNEWRSVMRVGDVGTDVSAWRFVLQLDGHDLSGGHNVFEGTVHNATVAWQKARALKADGVVGAKTRAAINAPVVQRPHVLFDPDAVQYVEATHWSRGVGAVPKDLIVIHSMEYPETSVGSEWCGAFFAGRCRDGKGNLIPAPEASANYAVDDDTVVCMVPPERIAWHAPGANQRGIGIEHSGYARQTRAQWLDDYSLRMLMLSAELTAHLCARFKIPVQFVMAEHLTRGGKGITTHAEVSKAYRKSTHWDPGPHFPISEYLRFVVDAGQRSSRALHSGV